MAEDLARRDFTCNSIAIRLLDHTLIDPFVGVQAIRQKRICMTGPESFLDDPLRVLRAARFAAVLKFQIEDAIYLKAKNVNLLDLSSERIVDELFRLLLESERPSRGLEEYFRLSVLEKLFPQLSSLTLTIQDANFHPEKDEQEHHTVWAHTLNTVDIAKKLAGLYRLPEERTLALLLAALLHDTGKATTTRWEYKRDRMTITSAFHDAAGLQLSEEFLGRLRIETLKNFPLKKVILSLVKNHHRIYDLFRLREEISFKAIARAVKDMEGEDALLLLLDFADRQSREADPLNFSDVDHIAHWFQAKKDEYHINQETIKPLVLGRDLKPLGIKPVRKWGFI